ncbi:MAG: hypothetical protein M1832_003175 [Thelocarpon impressellum]|nr:MAG: hypothetical protein M1832_003175 [Thelocarpon impressellum]
MPAPPAEDRQPLSALSSALSSSLPPSQSPHPAHLHTLAAQVSHNLTHAHDWTALSTHTRSPVAPHAPLPRPLLRGRPAARVYVHPDEQVAILLERKKRAADGRGREREMEAEQEERELVDSEWVLPTRLCETWSLARLAGVFDALPAPATTRGPDGRWAGERRKRVLLATVGDDSTVVYYILHDGIVKPRQN